MCGLAQQKQSIPEHLRYTIKDFNLEFPDDSSASNTSKKIAGRMGLRIALSAEWNANTIE